LPIRITLTLGLGLAIAGSALADTTYKIRPGDTIEVIAKKFHVRQGSLQSANGVHANTVLRVGRTIIVPGTVAKLDHKASPKVSKSSGGYVVRNGDQDWTLAEKLGITLKQLHQLNPGLNWSRLQIGQHLNVPGASHHAVASNDPAPKAGGSYTIQEGDNDWLIARRYDTTPKIIRQLNPDVHWDHVQIGHHIRVPSAQKVARASKPQFNSRYAVLTGDNVMIRRRPSIGSEAVAKVQAGTRVTVLDRDSGWYRLRFPYGTEGWVRGDYLHAAAPPARSHLGRG
jgi:LysM repeat protein